jgi:TRAP-type mannitol/chloroaromatic compound transport system substrate-binding protein
VLEKLGAENAFFKKVVDSQKDWVKRTVSYQRVNEPSRDLAFNHFFKT